MQTSLNGILMSRSALQLTKTPLGVRGPNALRHRTAARLSRSERTHSVYFR